MIAEAKMNPTEVLVDEHVVIVRVLDALKTAARRLDEGEQIRPGYFIDAADFIKGFADGCHHHKEEGVLFKAMESAGMPAQGGPIGVMLMEHERGRAFTRQMRAAAMRLENGDASARAEVVENARGYVALLHQHIMKENSVLFPMAEKVLPENSKAKVMQDFETIEHEETGEGVHEKYLALAEKLEKEVA
jgi:hemerythrin-like domain-containing protein